MSDKQNTTIVNLIGTGCKICIIDANEELMQKLKTAAVKMKLPLELAILDADFFMYLADEKLKSISDLSNSIIRGLLHDETAQIEIRVSGKKKRKILLSELLQQDLLFPLYNVILHAAPQIIPGSLLIVEKEKGLISGTKLFTEKLNLEKMEFEFAETHTGIEKIILLSRISHEGKKLNPTIKDTLVTSTYSITKN